MQVILTEQEFAQQKALRMKLLSDKYDLLAQRDQLKCELATLQSQMAEVQRDALGTETALKSLRAELENAVKISEMRLDLIKSLQHTVRTLKSTPVQVVRNPRTDTTKVVTIDVVHNYLQHGWVPLTGELLVGRPA